MSGESRRLAPGSGLIMSASPALSSSTPAHVAGAKNSARPPLCFVIDGDASIRHFLSLVLHGIGVDTEEFAHGKPVETALDKREPNLIFLNITLESSEAIE